MAPDLGLPLVQCKIAVRNIQIHLLRRNETPSVCRPEEEQIKVANLKHQPVSRICSSCTPTCPNYCMLWQRRRPMTPALARAVSHHVGDIRRCATFCMLASAGMHELAQKLVRRLCGCARGVAFRRSKMQARWSRCRRSCSTQIRHLHVFGHCCFFAAIDQLGAIRL